MGNAKDMTGLTIGKLTVMQRTENDKYGNAMWQCSCSCGNTAVVSGHSLRRGHTLSCGCFQKETASKTFKTHGCSKTPLYRQWAGMHQRCENPNSSAYKDYGAKGITVCDEWSDYTKFQEWAYCHDFAAGLTIDRIDIKKGYSPENCRWATRAEQNRNTSRTHRIIDGNRTLTAAEAGRLAGVSRSTVAEWCRDGRVRTMSDVYYLENQITDKKHKRREADA